MKCLRCGNENPGGSRFCNLCGTTLDRRQGERRQSDRRGSGAPARGRVPSIAPGDQSSQGKQPAEFARRAQASRPPEPLPVEDDRVPGPQPHGRRPSPVAGPSFLGLSAMEDRSPDYLLEDDEEPERRNGWRKYVLLLILIVVGVLFWMQWRSSTHAQSPWELLQPALQPAPESQPPSQEQPPLPQPRDSSQPPQTGGPAAQPSTPSDEKTAEPDQPSPAAPAKEPDDQPKPQAKAENPAQQPSQAEEPEAAPSEEAAQPETTRISRRAREPAAEDDPMLFMAQKYLYGRGVERNCDQALIYLRQAAGKPNPRARSQMGALYATGVCVPRDRVLAYQWFSSAVALDPGNSYLQGQRNSLWAGMTTDERQRAVR